MLIYILVLGFFCLLCNDQLSAAGSEAESGLAWQYDGPFVEGRSEDLRHRPERVEDRGK
jgi:hypothetical protein